MTKGRVEIRISTKTVASVGRAARQVTINETRSSGRVLKTVIVVPYLVGPESWEFEYGRHGDIAKALKVHQKNHPRPRTRA